MNGGMPYLMAIPSGCFHEGHWGRVVHIHTDRKVNANAQIMQTHTRRQYTTTV